MLRFLGATIGFGGIRTVSEWVWVVSSGCGFLLTGGIGNVGHLVLVRGWEQETFVSLEELLLLLPFPFPLFLLKSFFYSREV